MHYDPKYCLLSFNTVTLIWGWFLLSGEQMTLCLLVEMYLMCYQFIPCDDGRFHINWCRGYDTVVSENQNVLYVREL